MMLSFKKLNKGSNNCSLSKGRFLSVIGETSWHMTQERDQLRSVNSQLSQSVRGYSSASHSAPSNLVPGHPSAAHSAPEQSVLPEMRGSSSPQIHASSAASFVPTQPESSVIATLQSHIEQLTSKVIELQSQISPQQPSKAKRGSQRPLIPQDTPTAVCLQKRTKSMSWKRRE